MKLMKFDDLKLENVLKKYSDSDYEKKLKVKFAYKLCIAMMLTMIPIIVYTIFIFKHYTDGMSVNSFLVGAEITLILIFAVCFLLIVKGYFLLSSHLLFLSTFTVFWTVMLLDRSTMIIRLDTISYLLAVIALLPIFFDQWKIIFSYSISNIIILFCFLQLTFNDFNEELADYFADTSLSIIFITIVAYHITKIKRTLLDKAEHEILRLQVAEEIIEAEKEQLLVTLQSIGDGVITTDTGGRVVIINKVAQELTGWSHVEAYGEQLSKIFNIINEITGKKCPNPVEKVLDSGEIQELENHTVLISKDGTERIIADSGSPIRNTKGKIIGVVLVFRDMTEKQRLIDAAQKSQKLQSLGTLAGGIAHDFNNLLTGIYGMIGFAKDESDSEKVKNILVETGETIDRAKSLSHQLLTFAKGGTPVKKFQDIKRFVRDTVSFSLSGSNVSCSFIISGDLKKVEYDMNQLSQVIDNIVLNAVQAMPDGGELTVSAENQFIKESEVDLPASGDFVKISISDTGPGIPQKIMSKIFDPFFSTKKSGQGLGLAMCYSIVSKHNGFITADSRTGKGTTFAIFLPASNKENHEPLLETKSSGTMIKNGKFLIMDDDFIVNQVTEKIVSQLGFESVSVTNGQEAVEKFKKALNTERKFDVLIFDLTVQSGMGGKEAISIIRKIDKDVIALVSTGYSEDPVISDPNAYGFNDSISKPFSAEELTAKLQKYLG